MPRYGMPDTFHSDDWRGDWKLTMHRIRDGLRRMKECKEKWGEPTTGLYMDWRYADEFRIIMERFRGVSEDNRNFGFRRFILEMERFVV